MATDVGFIGLGTMGGPMARNLLRGGHSVIGYRHERRRGGALVEAGGVPPPRPARRPEVPRWSIAMLPDGPDVERAVLGDAARSGGLRRGRS